MKLKKWITLGAALSFLLAAQPAYAAPVVTAGVNQSVQTPEEAAQDAAQSSGVVAGEAPAGNDNRQRHLRVSDDPETKQPLGGPG